MVNRKKNGHSLQLSGSHQFVDWQLNLPNSKRLELDIDTSVDRPSLIIFEAVSLREINEVYGRSTGDKVIATIKDYILSWENHFSSLYRIGGNKFCVAINHTAPEAINTTIDTIFNRFYQPWHISINDSDFKIFCRFVICVVQSSFIQSSEYLLNIVDMTLQSAKSKNRIVYYDNEMAKEFRNRQNFIFSLVSCVANNMNGFEVHYQPIADPATGIWCAIEALCRWDSPELGLIQPYLFIPEAERIGLIDTIGIWVLETAICQCKSWGLDKVKHFMLEVNVSSIQFADTKLVQKIIQILKNNDYPGEKLCLEITECTQFTLSDEDSDMFTQLKDAKISIALDDFGTGYSTFERLKKLPADIIKVERMFIANIESDSYLRILFQAITGLAHAVGMKVIAEGVENEIQMSILLEHGADLLQGYLFSEPIAPDKMIYMLQHFYEPDDIKYCENK